MNRFFIANAIFAAVAPQSPTLAQIAQTQEGAISFLNQALTNVKYNMNNYRSDGREIDASSDAPDMFAGSLGEAKPLSDAKCTVRFNYSRPSFTYRGGSWNSVYLPEVYFNFKEISDVTVLSSQPKTVRFVTAESTLPQFLYLGSEAMATRVAYAMNFLKDACNPMAKTGF